MLKTEEELLAVLDDLGVDYVNHRHPAVFTVEEAARHAEGIEGAHCKNLFLKDRKKRLFLVVTLAQKPINLKELAGVIGAKGPYFARPEVLEEVLGVIPGAVTPLAAVNIGDRDVTIILDEELMAHDRMNFHPLENTATTTLSPDGLMTFLAHCGQEPRILQL